MNSADSQVRVPCATYRLQFNAGFTFQQAADLVDYLHELGISDCYCSPLFGAPPDSNHGYDVCDFTVLNPVLGSLPDWQRFVSAVKERDMGILLDFVPNHMGAVPPLNRWWTDVLEKGGDSPYATYFDIDWQAPHLPMANKLLLPVLGDHYGRFLKQGGIKLFFEHGRFCIGIGALRLPVCLTSHRLILESALPVLEPGCRRRVEGIMNLLPINGDPLKPARVHEARRRLTELEEDECLRAFMAHHAATFGEPDDPQSINRLHEVLEQQAYRLVYWQSGTRIANYRRFFDVDSLVALRMELPEVFEATHHLVLKLIGEGQVTGLRLDHIDGLAEPEAYLRRLQESIARAKGVEYSEHDRSFYVLVEKITMQDEPLRKSWPVAGTSGYEFAREVTGVLVNRENESEIDRIYRQFTGYEGVLAEDVLAAKKLVMGLAMSKEINGLSRLLHQCAEQRRHARDLLFEDLRSAVRETIGALTVYRTYCVPGKQVAEEDRRIIDEAVSRARTANPDLEPLAWDFLRQVLLGELEEGPGEKEKLFARRFQQATGAIMAKGFEDTVFYVYNRLNALNEVGGNPAAFGLPVNEFHRLNAERQRHWPHTMVCTSTHDTKVSEDVRARLAVLSEMPGEWENFLRTASRINRESKREVGGRLAPDGNEEYLFYQMLLGTWPMDDCDPEGRAAYLERMKAYLTKALNEAKVNTRWDRRNEAWEEAVLQFAENAINGTSREFAEVFAPFAAEVARWGALNSLSQLLLKMTAPGVPDFYQGNELWQFILVDPDNRGQIDYGQRRRMLEKIAGKSPKSLLADWRDGGIKIYLTKTVLQFRRKHAELFREGTYRPLECAGAFGDCCIAFAREHGSQRLVTLTARTASRLGYPPLSERWKDTTVSIPEGTGCTFRDLLTGQEYQGVQLSVAEVFKTLPFAVLYSEDRL